MNLNSSLLLYKKRFNKTFSFRYNYLKVEIKCKIILQKRNITSHRYCDAYIGFCEVGTTIDVRNRGFQYGTFMKKS